MYFVYYTLQGAGCGEELATWIIHGRPHLDMFSYDIRQAILR